MLSGLGEVWRELAVVLFSFSLAFFIYSLCVYMVSVKVLQLLHTGVYLLRRKTVECLRLQLHRKESVSCHGSDKKHETTADQNSVKFVRCTYGVLC